MDMYVVVMILLEDCPNFDSKDKNVKKQWSGEDYVGANVLFYKNYALENEDRWASYRHEYSQYMVELQSMLNDVKRAPINNSSNGLPELPLHEYSNICHVILNGFRLLSELTTSVQYQCSWKSGHAAKRESTLDKSTGNIVNNVLGVEYALATVHNYTGTEIKVLVDVLSMIKSLANLLNVAESTFSSIIRYYTYRETQIFIQHTILGLLYKAHKHKRTKELEHLMQLRTLCADWVGDVEPFEDYKSKAKIREVRNAYDDIKYQLETFSEYLNASNTKLNDTIKRINAEIKAENVAPLPIRVVGPTSSQISIIRCMVHALYDERAPWLKKGSLFSSGTFTEKDLIQMKNYYNSSYYYNFLLNYNETVEKCSNVSSLWYREFYLELTKQVQFPISMSLPWKLSEYVIKNPSNNMLNNVFYCIDIYNDVANVALNVFHVQHIYDEIEAEVNLVFDQLIYLLNEEVYSHYKNISSMLHLNDHFIKTLKSIQSLKKEKKNDKIGTATNLLKQFNDPSFNKYTSVVSQRHIQLLGRTIDFRSLIIERLNTSIRIDMEIIITKFESGDLTGICELNDALIILRETRNNLCIMLENDSALDEFDMVLHEINESVGSGSSSRSGGGHNSNHGRIAKHILIELVNDIYPNWVFNEVTRRFIKPSNASIRKNQHLQHINKRCKKPKGADNIFGRKYKKAYDIHFRLLKGYVGREHCENIVNVLESTSDIYTVLEELISYQHIMIKDEIAPYVAQLQLGLRPIKLPPYQLKAGGSYLAIQLTLKPIMDYEDLKTQVFQNFRETGNALAFFHLMDATMTQSNCFEFVATSSFFGVTPETLDLTTTNNSNIEEREEEEKNSSSSSSVPFLDLMKNATDQMPLEGGMSLLDMAKEAVEMYSIGGTNNLHSTQRHRRGSSLFRSTSGGTEYGSRTRDPLLTVALRAMKSAVEDTMEETRKGGLWGPDSQQRMDGINEDEEGGGRGDSNERKGRNIRSSSTASLDDYDDSPYLWNDSIEPKNGIIDCETTKAFHRIYSAMLFMFCEPEPGFDVETNQPSLPKPLSDHQEFGDGMAWCGIALIHLLQQKECFNLLDFSSHLLSVSEWEGMHETDMVGNVDQKTLNTLNFFLRSAKESQKQNKRLFELFESHLPNDVSDLLVFRPPDLNMSKSIEGENIVE
jgi:cytoplasmic FMR1 interacting protein